MNVQKAVKGTDFIARKCSEYESFICGIQEGYFKEGKSEKLDKSHKVMHAQVDKCRTLLYCNRSIPLWFMPKFSGRDVCTGMWQTKEQGTILISSVYWDGTKDELPDEYPVVLKYSRDKGYKHLTLMDSNAHSFAFGSKSQDDRGTLIEELIDELRQNYAIAIVTHSMQQAARVSQRTAYFHLGKLVEVGSTNHIFTNPSHELTENYITGRFG